MLRADHGITKFLYGEYGLKRVMEWQCLPLLDMRANQPTLAELTSVKVAGAYDHLPFDDAVYLSSTVGSEYLNRFAYQLTRVDPDALMNNMRYVHNSDVPDWEDPLLLHVIFQVFCGGEFSEFICITDNRSGHSAIRKDGTVGHLSDEDATTLQRIVTRISASDARYLAQCTEHMVEETAVTRTGRGLAKATKTAKKKPWLREDLSTIILIDPVKAK